MRRGDAVGDKPADEIGPLGREIVVAPVLVVVREAPTAIVEGEDPSRRVARLGERRRENVEIIGAAGQAGKADDGRTLLVTARRKLAHMQSQTV